MSGDDSVLNGPEDPWNHAIWVAAWGRNAPLVASDSDYRLPRVPEGMGWLPRRLLVGGRTVIELSLLRPGGDRVDVVGRARVRAEPSVVEDRAGRMVQDLTN